MAEIITDTRPQIRQIPASIDNLNDAELDEWLRKLRGTRMLHPAHTTTKRKPKTTDKDKPKRSKSKLTDEVDFF